jgi:hypothetical protein
VTTCGEKLCSGTREKEGGASGIVALEGVGDEEMLDGQGGMASRLNEVVIKELSNVLLISNNHIMNMPYLSSLVTIAAHAPAGIQWGEQVFDNIYIYVI